MSRGTYVPYECKGLHASNAESLNDELDVPFQMLIDKQNGAATICSCANYLTTTEKLL